jgi:hypothetical protein
VHLHSLKSRVKKGGQGTYRLNLPEIYWRGRHNRTTGGGLQVTSQTGHVLETKGKKAEDLEALSGDQLL